MTQSDGSTTPDAHKAPKWIPWAAFILIGIPLIIWAVMQQDEEKVAAEAFLDALEDKAYDRAFDLLSGDAQGRYGSPAALADELPLDEWITYNRDGQDRANDALDASARFGGQDRKGFTIYLIEDGQGEWRVEGIRDWR